MGLQKLQKLCDIVNDRYAKGLNDDNQVSSMFSYAEKIKNEAQIIIGWDTYQALEIDKIKGYYLRCCKDDIDGKMFRFTHTDNKSYRTQIPN